jgi:two-component system cell cycle sensor histidine kinase/response regulator CckA
MPSDGDASLETILVVDDNDVVLKSVCLILKDAGFDVLSASSGPDASRVSSERVGAIHLLLSDVEMPEISGPDLGQMLKKTRPEMRVMLMSGGANGSLLVLNYGWAYVQKPFVTEKLLQMVRSVLRSPDRSQAGGHGFDSRMDRSK